MVKFFVIEDQALYLHALEAQLSHAGYEVMTDGGSREIEAIVNDMRAFFPDYILMDLVLPVNDGLQLLRHIREQEDLIDTPVFVFTDYSDDDIKTRTKLLGVDYYFVKTDLNVEELVKKVEKIIQNRTKLAGNF